MPFIPHTKADVQAMLAAIGVNSIEDLFDEIPQTLRAGTLTNIPEGVTEMELSRVLQERAQQNYPGLNFIGAGAYEHHIPAAVWDIVSRGEFMTAYTPYQAEASQGTLQLIYEYQTMMAGLTGMEVANASLYDGATALAEAVLMAVRANRHSKTQRILMPRTVHPLYRQVVHTVVRNQQIELIELPYCPRGGYLNPESLKHFANEDITALVIPQPNFFGVLEEVDELTDWARQKGALVIAVVNPTALALLKEPGQWGKQGVDIVCGEGQPLGVPLASGGPYFGFLCCKKEHVRQMPGRIVGQTVDLDGKRGFTLTLQAREQHIRRAKATSNICTNQGLLVTAATIYMSLMGPEGLKRVAAWCHANTRSLVEKLTQLPGVSLAFDRPFFHEVVLRLPKATHETLQQLAVAGIQGGFDLAQHYPGLGDAVLVCATETKTEKELEKYHDQLAQIYNLKKHLRMPHANL
jgi:glycine dehydrogenase subunit 1